MRFEAKSLITKFTPDKEVCKYFIYEAYKRTKFNMFNVRQNMRREEHFSFRNLELNASLQLIIWNNLYTLINFNCHEKSL